MKIVFPKTVAEAVSGADLLFLAAPKAALAERWHRVALKTAWAAALDRVAEDAKPGDNGGTGVTYGPEGAPRRIIVAALPDKVSRHNCPARAESLRHVLADLKPGDAKRVAVVLRLDRPDHWLAAALPVARAFPLFSRKTGEKGSKEKSLAIVALGPDSEVVHPSAGDLATIEAVRNAARLCDTPPEDLRTADLEREARKAVRGIRGVTVRSIVGERLIEAGLGGIHAVGRAATVAPRLTVLTYSPVKKPRRTVALVGKGIVYDTGGLSLKVGGIMVNMKSDMGGAAAVLGAFAVLARAGGPDRIHALLCLAENAVGPDSYRPDDILTMHSRKTVEINNTDAEGRLLLADGVSFAARNLKADVVIDVATLTGAALVTTGQAVSCAVSNRAELEAAAVEAGRRTGDLTHPILFLPELLKSEFASKVADMRNSVKDRMNAQSSCAAQFVYNHIEDLDRPWLHLDIAGPAFRDGRGTGYGVALLVEILGTL
ncbi:MAG: leucyl aminopeptidase family protein [Planctomycetes bacterium]|jgi:probable aminopeptidase NPEPL1|nr:leucyl aminopeptidase family protein [Planctomycetota bacterium]